MRRSLKAIRLSKDMSQPAFAKLLNIHRITLINYETKKRVPSLHFLYYAAHILGMDVNDIQETHVKRKTAKSL